MSSYNTGKDKQIELYAPYVPHGKLDELLRFVKEKDFTKGPKGGTSMYLPFDDNIGVLYSLLFRKNLTSKEYRQTIEDVRRIYGRGGKVAPILGYIRRLDRRGIPNNAYNPKKHGGGRDAVFVTRAPGQTLNDTSYIKKWYLKTSERLDLSTTCTHYDDLIDTFMNILDSGIKPDISGNNIIHHPAAGFNFIDFNKQQDGRLPDYERDNVTRLLQSFVIRKGFSNERIKEKYFRDASKEQQILVTKLLYKGIKEKDLEYAVSQVDGLNAPTLDALFSK